MMKGRLTSLAGAIAALLADSSALIASTVPAQAQYVCPPGYYYDPTYGCVPNGYFTGPPYYAYPDFGFDFFYGGGWGGRGRGGYGGGGFHGGGGGHGGGGFHGGGGGHGGGGHGGGHR
jgi:hypothetical protein